MSAEVREIKIYEVVCVACGMYEPANDEAEAGAYARDHDREFHDGGDR